MDIQSIMTRKLVTVSPDDAVSKVRELFNMWRFHHLLVTENRRLVGVVSDRDLLKNLSPFLGREMAERPQDVALLDRKVHQIMTRRLVTAGPEMVIENAIRLMVAQQVSCLPVTNEKGQPVGIVTWKDLFRAMVPGLELPPMRRDEVDPAVPPAVDIDTRTAVSLTTPGNL
jgi:acetoin utilization protein AcuB